MRSIWLCVEIDTDACVLAEKEGFRIFSDGKEFVYKYKYRKPVSEVCRITTNNGHFRIGKVSVNSSV